MKDKNKTKNQILEELEKATKRIAELENSASKRMQAEQALRESEKLYRSLFENMLNGFAYCKMLFDQGRPIDFICLDVNNAFESLMGLKDVTGRKASEIFPGVQQLDSKVFEILSRVALTGKSERFEYYLKAMKQWFWISAYSPKKEYFVTIFDVITESKQAEKALLERDALFAKISSQVPGMLYQFMRKPDGSYSVPYSNHGVYDIFGCKPEDVRNNFDPIFNVILPEDRGKVTQTIDESARSLSPWTCEYRVQIPGKPVRWIFGNSIPEKLTDGSIVWIGYNTDITERKKTEETLKIFQYTIDQAPEAIQWVNRDAGFEYVNEEACRSLGYNRDEIMRLKLWDIDPTFSKERWESYWDRLKNGEQMGTVLIESKHCRKDGTLFSVELRAQHLWLADREMLVAAILDISERKKGEEALRESEKHYRSLFENIFNGYAYCKILLEQGRPTDFIYLEVNSAFEPLTGMKNVTGKKVSEVMPGVQKTNPELFDILGRVALTGNPERFDIYLEALKQWFSVSVYSLEKEYFVTIFENITERKLADEALRRSEEKYRLITDNITDVIFTTDISGTYTFISSSHKRVLERGEEVLGRSIYEHIHPEDVPGVMAAFGDAVKSGHIARAEFRYLHPSRGYIWLESQGMAIDMHGTPTGVIVSRDITVRKQAEEALLTEQSFTKALLDSLPGIFYLYTYPDFHLVRWNKNHETLLGFGPGEINNRHIMEWHIPEAKEAVRQAMEVVMEKGQNMIESPLLMKDGRQIPFLMTGVRLDVLGNSYILGVGIDITERKLADEALRRSEERYRRITENMSDFVSELDADGRFIYVSPSIRRILGYDPEELIGISAFDLIHPEDREHVITKYTEGIHTGSDRDIEQRYRHKDGTYIWIRSSGHAIYGSAGEHIGSIINSNDITERKHLEEEQVKLEERLQQSYKMEAIGTLAGGIAHDFNNILSAILGYTELAKMGMKDGKTIYHYLEEILHAGIRARDLVKQILTFSRQAGIKREPMEVAPLIKETMKFLRASLPVTIDIRQDITVSDSVVIGDPTQIHQIIMNLCTNAAHAMKEKGGILDIRLAKVELDDDTKLSFEGLNRGRYLQLTVADTGSGIPKEIIKKIFDPFFTTKERGEGTGMGLSVVHGIVKDMGGAVSVYSEPGQGSTFHVLFPTYEGQSFVNYTSNMSSKTGSGKILFVDDEDQIIASGRGILEHLGYQVVSTTSPLEALEIFRSRMDEFNLVLTDMTMPKMTGLELSEQLLKIRPDIPIVLCSGFSMGITAERIRNLGIKKLIMKPMIADELANAVYSALNPDRA